MKFKIMGEKGDFEGVYDTKAAAVKFGELVNAGMKALVKKDGKNKLTKTFDPEAEEVTFIKPITGG